MEQVYKDKYHCCGCRACEDICVHRAITMKQDEEGFLYPSIDSELCVDCGACNDICPQKGVLSYTNHRLSKAYGLMHKDKNIRRMSTSGGAFTAIAETLYSKYPDLIIYGSVLKKRDVGGFCAVHERIEGLDDIGKFRGSKYIQSDMDGVYKLVRSDLQNGRHILFTGTPCQIAGIHKRFRRTPNFDNLYLVDIVCHAVPSPLMFNEHIRYIEKKKNRRITNYKFRSKITGWGHCEAAYFGDDVMFRNRMSQNHRDLFYKNIINRPSCDICQHADDNHLSDLTMADFWGIERIAPDFNDCYGTSLVLANTTKGDSLIGEMCCADLIEVNRSKAMELNHHIPSPANSQRKEFWEDYFRYGYEFVLDRYAENTIQGKLIWYAKAIIRKLLPDEVRARIKRILGLG